MILRSIELMNFGQFRDKTFEFRRGMNLVIGPNEAGKSTLAEAVPAVLFGTSQLERYKPWGRNACDAALFFEGGGRTIQVKRNLLTDVVELVEKDDMYHVLSQFSGKAPLKGRSASRREYRELVAKLLGVGDDRLFRATYFFGHHPQEWSGDDLAQNLRTLVSGTAEADYAEILDELLEEHFNLTSSNPWGRDKKQSREYEDICRQIEESGVRETVPVFVETETPDDLSEQVEELEAELLKDRIEFEKGQKYVDHLRSQKKLQVVDKAGRDEALPQPVVMHDQEPIAARLKEAGLPENPPRELPGLLTEATQIRQEMAELQQPYSVLNSREKKVPVVPWGMLGTVLLVCVVAYAAAWWFRFAPMFVAGVAGLVAAFCVARGAWRHLARKKALAECREERNRLDRKKIAAQDKQTELSERCEALGLPSSPIDLVRLHKLVAAHGDLLQAFWDDKESTSVDPGKVGSLETDRETAAPGGEHFAEVAENDEELQELEQRLTDFEKQMRDKQARLETLRQQQHNNRQNMRQSGDASDEGSLLCRRKHELEESIAVLRKAVDLLAGSVEDFGQSHLVKLNKEAGKAFGKITSGLYRELRLDENMLPSVKIDGRRWVPVDRFSRGTVDAIYLALRIGLARVRDDGRSLPLMLDDPFVHLDQKRLSKALNTVDLASADGQLILFSHNMDMGRRAAKERWHVIPLDREQGEATHEEEVGGTDAGQLHLL